MNGVSFTQLSSHLIDKISTSLKSFGYISFLLYRTPALLDPLHRSGGFYLIISGGSEIVFNPVVIHKVCPGNDYTNYDAAIAFSMKFTRYFICPSDRCLLSPREGVRLHFFGYFR